MKISEKTSISEILKSNPKAIEILLNSGMHCVGCPMSMMETLENGCLAHGFTKKQIKEIVDKLNKK